MTIMGNGDVVSHGVIAKIFACVFIFDGLIVVGLLLSIITYYLVGINPSLLPGFMVYN